MVLGDVAWALTEIEGEDIRIQKEAAFQRFYDEPLMRRDNRTRSHPGREPLPTGPPPSLRARHRPRGAPQKANGPEWKRHYVTCVLISNSKNAYAQNKTAS